MGMFSEITTENTVFAFVKEISKDLKACDNEQAAQALRKLGRFALTQFEWSTPDWAAEYKKLFAEP